MPKRISSRLYGLARKISKAGSVANDIETILSGDPKRITTHFVRKKVYKTANKSMRKVIRKIK